MRRYGGPNDLDVSDVKRGILLVACGFVCYWLAPLVPARPLWFLWSAGIVAVTVPWLDFHRRPLWWTIAWIPFVSPPITLFDLVSNILLFIPFGLLYARAAAGPHLIWRAAGWGALLSTAVEASQVFSRGRIASGTDVVTNVIGAAIGAALWRQLENRRGGDHPGVTA